MTSSNIIPNGSPLELPPAIAAHWTLDPDVHFLNHGSFGACPRPVQERQQSLRDELESEPVRFMTRRLQPLLDRAREKLAAFLHTDPNHLVLIPNATAGTNAVLRSQHFQPGDDILVTSHGYNACNNVARYVAQRDGAKVVIANVPFPLSSASQVLDNIFEALTPRTRFAVIDHITSATGLVLPVQEITSALRDRHIDVLVDGAHAAAQVPLDLSAINAPFYTGNCHKWLCAPKGAGFLYVHPERQPEIIPPVISHGWNTSREDHSRFSDLFDWPGTVDPTPWCCIPDAIDFVSTLLPGGLDELMQRNRALALHARDLLCNTLNITVPAPDNMIGAMAAIPLPDDPSPTPRLDPISSPLPTHQLQVELYKNHNIEIPCPYFPRHPQRLIRHSAQAYNHPAQYQHLAQALRKELATETSPKD